MSISGKSAAGFSAEENICKVFYPGNKNKQGEFFIPVLHLFGNDSILLTGIKEFLKFHPPEDFRYNLKQSDSEQISPSTQGFLLFTDFFLDSSVISNPELNPSPPKDTWIILASFESEFE